MAEHSYDVTVTRTGYRSKVVRVEAPDAKRAKEVALETAGNLEFPPEHDCDYEVQGAVRMDAEEPDRFPISFEVLVGGKLHSRHSVRNDKEKASILAAIRQIHGEVEVR